jgi:hypothetical protein
MPDRDAIRARADLKQIEASIRRLHYYGDPPDVRLQQDVDGDVLDIMDRILATLATAEERYAALEAEITEYRAGLMAEAARADAAERRGERMLAAVVAASHTVIPDHGAEWMNGFAAGQRAMRAALARAASGGREPL